MALTEASVRAGDSEWPAAWPEGLGRVAHASVASASTSSVLPPLPGASPSVRFVYASIRETGAITTSDIALRTGLPDRTVRHAVRWLAKQGLAIRLHVLGDARKNRIQVGAFRTPVPVC